MKQPDFEPKEISLVKRPRGGQWIKVIEVLDEGVRVWHGGMNRWYRWARIQKAR